MTALTPQQMRELADAVDWPGVPGEPSAVTPEARSNAAVALRTAADQLEAVQKRPSLVEIQHILSMAYSNNYEHGGGRPADRWARMAVAVQKLWDADTAPQEDRDAS